MVQKFLPVLFLVLGFQVSEAQTVKLLKDINPGVDGSTASGNRNVIAHKGILYFTAKESVFGSELYKYDGKEVTLVKDINPGVADSKCENFLVVNDILLFTANNNTNGVEWWTTDGTEVGTKLLKDISPGTGAGVISGSSSQSVYNDGKIVYFSGGSSQNYELWKTDGTAAGTVLVKNIAPDTPSASGSFPDYFTKFKGAVYFNSRNGLHKTDGTEAGTVLIRNTTDFVDLFNFNDQYLLMIKGNNLWRSDGTNAGTIQIKTMSSVSRNWSGNRFTLLGNIVLFPGADNANGEELWKTDGTDVGTSMVIDLYPGDEGYSPQNQVVLNGKYFFKGEKNGTGIELFVSDGTSAGTKLFYEFQSGFGSGFSLPTEIITDGKLIYMNGGPSFAKHLWVSDGTVAGTKEIKLNTSRESFPFNFYKFGNNLFLYASSDAGGDEPYIVEFPNVVVDNDKDGFTSDVDCDDNNAAINPGAVEICDGKDNNCNGSVDDGLPQFTFYEDKDNDGFGNASVTKTGCSNVPPTGFVASNTDCNDTNANINPAATDIANNGIDEDCNGSDKTSSVYDVYASKINIIPNPASTTFSITHIEAKTIQASLYTATGVLLRKLSPDTNNDISDLNSGIYLIHIATNDLDLPVFKKLIVSR